MTKQSTRSSAIELKMQEMKWGGATEKCVNLRHTRVAENDALEVAPQPERVCDYPLTPLVKITDGGEWLFYSPCDAEGNCELYAGVPESEPEWILQLHGEPRCGVTTQDGAVIMLPDGPVKINRKGKEWQSGESERPAVCPVTMTAVAKGTLTKTTSGINLELNISGQAASPDSNSLSRLGTALMTSYSALSTEALAGGVWIQPVGVRCRLLDGNGNELWRSPMNIVAIDGWQCTDAITGSLTGGGSSYTTSALNIAAKSFAINVSVEARSVLGGKATVAVIEATPQLHPIISDRAPRTRISAITGNSPQISVWMPGVQPEESATTAMQTARLQACAMMPDALMTRIGRIDLTTGSGTTVQLTPTSSPTAEEEIKILEKATAETPTNPPSVWDNPLSQIIAGSQPFTAGCVVQNGDTTVWGNISSVRAKGTHPFPSVASTTNGEWQAALTINTGASSFTTRYSGTDNCPTAIGPIIMVELPEAVSAILYVRQGTSGTISEASFELSPTPNGLMSCHISTGLKPITLKQSTINSLPAATAYSGEPDEMRGSVIVAHSGEPTKALCGGVCSQGEIKALATAVKSQSSWDFSRCHVYAFATDGIYTVAANTRTLAVTSSRIDSRGVTDARAVAYTPKGVVAIAGGQAISCSASSVKPLVPLPSAQRYALTNVAWHRETDELWFTDTQGNILILNGEEWHYLLVPERVENISETTDSIWLTGAENSYRVSEAGACNAEWQSSLMLPAPGRVIDVCIPCAASRFEGTIEIRAHNGAGAESSMPVTKLSINGEINAPIHARIIAPRRLWLVMRVSAKVSRDFHLCPINLTISRRGLR